MCEKNGWTKTLRGMTKFGAVAERNKTMSVRDIELFTEITGDRNPLHNDDKRTNLLIVGAGPFGLAIAAYARHLGIEHLIVGKPMGFWKANQSVKASAETRSLVRRIQGIMRYRLYLRSLS